jgi:hypothetical protein
VEASIYGAAVDGPGIQHHPLRKLITSTLNTATMLRFGLTAAFLTEGGVEGKYKGMPVALLNLDRRLGLDIEEQCLPGNAIVLGWYGELLKVLFWDELVVDGQSYGTTAILKLNPDDYVDELRAKLLLYLALKKKTGSQGFATEVFKKLDALDGFESLYIAGLSDEKVQRLYVPPPL